MLAESQRSDADGSTVVPFRSGVERELITKNYFEEAVREGRMFALATAIAGVTIAAGNVIAASNTKPLVGLYNPTADRDIVIWRADHVWNSGTTGAGGLVWGGVPLATGLLTVQGSLTAAVNLKTQQTNSVMQQFVNAALTGLTATLIRLAGGPSVGAIAASSALSFVDDVKGCLIIPPGAVMGLFAGVAGTSPIVSASIVYEERRK